MAALPEMPMPGDTMPEMTEIDGGEPEERAEPLDRDQDLLGRATSKLRRHLDKVWDQILRGFQDQADRSDDLDQLWNLWYCELDDQQFYNGNAQVYVPIIHDALKARVTRFSNQLFPANGRYVDCTSSDGGQPMEVMAIASHYIREAKLKTRVVKPLLLHGDIEGQYNLYVDWTEYRRQVVSRETHGTTGDAGEDMGDDDIEDLREDDLMIGRPGFEVLHDSDVLVLPATADTLDDAFASGGCAVIVRRMSKEKLEGMKESGEFRDDAFDDEDFEGLMVSEAGVAGLPDLDKDMCRAVGIRARGKTALVFEVWLMLPLDERGRYSEKGENRLCRAWMGLQRRWFGCKRNPYWNDMCPLLSEPVEKVPGSFKGNSLVAPLAPLQYEANDAANEGADADHFAAMPIVVRDPSQGNAPLILNLAAVWDMPPGAVKFMEFPDLSNRAISRIVRCSTAIFQSLGVNPAMLPQQTGRPGAKRNQAEVALEQSVDLLTTAEAVSVIEECVLTPMAEWIIDLDHQFRDTDLTIRQFGELGVRAEMMDVPVLQNRHRYQFVWCGAEQARMNVAMQQQGTAFINVARGMRQDLMAEGFELRLGPLLERSAVNIFGPMTGALVLVDRRRQMTVPADLEDQLLAEGHEAPVHPLDNDAEHIRSHMQAAQMSGDPHGMFQIHIQGHMMQMQAKSAAMRRQMMGAQGQAMGGAPGVPGGAGPGVPGTPRQGAMPAGPRLIKQQPGAVPPDQMSRMGAMVPPRRA